MIAFEKLVALFDLRQTTVFPAQPPTDSSIATINTHFGVTLPPMLVRFARVSQKFGCYFASLGEDYENDSHILRINKQFGRVRRRRQGRWQQVKPEYLLVINHGHDNDCDCLDLRSWNPQTGDYALRYWTPSTQHVDAESEGWPTFHAYLEWLAVPDISKLRGQHKERVRTILES
jgi:hypothetical protein